MKIWGIIRGTEKRRASETDNRIHRAESRSLMHQYPKMPLKGATSPYFEFFLQRSKLRFKCWETKKIMVFAKEEKHQRPG